MVISMDGVGERIRQVRQTHGLVQKDFAASLGIAQGFLSSLERGKKFPSDTLLIALTHRYGVDEKWLLKGEGEYTGGEATDLPPSAARGQIPLLRRVRPELRDGLDSRDVVGQVAWPGSPQDGYAMFAYGDFMAPTIQDSDLVLFRLGSDARHGDVVLVPSRWGDIILRRYRIGKNGLWLTADNSAYHAFQPSSDSPIIGVVTDVWRKVRV